MPDRVGLSVAQANARAKFKQERKRRATLDGESIHLRVSQQMREFLEAEAGTRGDVSKVLRSLVEARMLDSRDSLETPPTTPA